VAGFSSIRRHLPPGSLFR